MSREALEDIVVSVVSKVDELSQRVVSLERQQSASQAPQVSMSPAHRVDEDDGLKGVLRALQVSSSMTTAHEIAKSTGWVRSDDPCTKPLFPKLPDGLCPYGFPYSVRNTLLPMINEVPSVMALGHAAISKAIWGFFNRQRLCAFSPLGHMLMDEKKIQDAAEVLVAIRFSDSGDVCDESAKLALLLGRARWSPGQVTAEEKWMKQARGEVGVPIDDLVGMLIPKYLEYSTEADQCAAREKAEAKEAAEKEKRPVAISHAAVKDTLRNAKGGDTVKVSWQLRQEKGEWEGKLARVSPKSRVWSVVYDLGDKEFDTFIPNSEVVYYSVELVPSSSPVAEDPATNIVDKTNIIPRSRFVAFRYRRPGSKWHFGEVEKGTLSVSRRIYDGTVVPMRKRPVNPQEVTQALALRRLPPLGTYWTPDEVASVATPPPSSVGSSPPLATITTPSSTATTTAAPKKSEGLGKPLTGPTAPLGALVGGAVGVAPVDESKPREEPDGEDELALIEHNLGDLTCSNVPMPEGFQRCHAQGPRVTDLKGSHFVDMVLTESNPKTLPNKALALPTVKAHKRALRQLKELPESLHNLPLDKALVNHFTAQKKKLKWSTLVTKMATVHGALRLLPLYSANKASVMMKESVVWMQSMKGAAKECKQEVPNQATPASWEMVSSALEKEPLEVRRLALLLTWLTCGRGGDVLKLEPDCVEIQETGLMVHFRRGKTVKTRGAYSIFTPLPPGAHLPLFVGHLEACKKEKKKWLFEGVQGCHIKEALRRADPKLEQRSLRRGAIQTLAATNLSDEELLKYSGHTNVQMLRRYLNFGKLSGEGRRLQQQGQALLQSSLPGPK